MRSISAGLAVLVTLGCALTVGCEPPSVEGDPFDVTPLPRRQTPDDGGGSTSRESTTTGASIDAGAGDDASCGASCDGSIDAAAPTVTQTFTIGPTDCGGGRCSGGYDDVKDPDQLLTADKQCADRGFARAIDFMIGGQPGGRFCSWNGTVYGCDPSCSGCNTMASVTCAKP